MHEAPTVTSVFGDTRLRNKDFRVRPQGIDSLETSPWAELRNTRRYLRPLGLQALAVGASNAVRNRTPSVAPAGWASQQFGDGLVVGLRVRRVHPSGVPALLVPVGRPSLWQTPGLWAAGIPAPAVPAPLVAPGRRYVEQLGHQSERLGMPTVGFSYRLVEVDGKGIAGAGYGLQRVEHSVRAVLMQGPSLEGYGSPWVSFGRRYVEPREIKAPLMPPPMVGGLRYLGVEGFEATRFGSRITPEARVLYPFGPREVWGWPEVKNRVRFLKPDSIRTYPQPYQHWGTAKVWNRRQYIDQYEDQSNGLWPPSRPLWTAIENRNRVMHAIGANASTVPRPAVDNKARPIYPGGLRAPSLPAYYKAGMVSHRVRRLHLDGQEAPYFGGWSNVSNAAVPLLPKGLVATLVGIAKVVNTRRYYKVLGFDSAWFGYPFIADRIRTLTFEPRYTIGAPSIPLPKVALYQRYLSPKGIDHPEVGAAALDIHWNRILPKWTLQHYFGWATLRNRTPELLTRGRATDEYGDTHLRLQWRPVDGIGTDTSLFGRAMIADSRQRIYVPGANYMTVSDKLVVVRMGAPPLSKQYVWVDHNDQWNSDFIDLRHQVSAPIINQQVIYVRQIDPHTAMGRPEVKANTIRVEPGIYELTVGEPMVSLKHRKLAPKGIEPQEIKFGKPRFSPWTIYAVVEAPEQALKNYPPPAGQLHYVDSGKPGGAGAVLGWVRVENRHRGVRAESAWTGESFGRVELYNRKQYVKPSGVNVLRMGWVSIPGDQIVEQDIAMEPGGIGSHLVGRPPYVGPRFLNPQGMEGAIGRARVEHFHRRLTAGGTETLQMGASRDEPAGPYKWQTLHVGPSMPTKPLGIASDAWGFTWVSLKVRELKPKGWDSFICDYDDTQFAKRMRVRLGTSNTPPMRRIFPRGDVLGHVAAPGLRPGTHYIRPDGNSDQYRKGAF